MALDTEQKRRTALTFGRTVPMILPKVGAVPVLGSMDRALMLGCWPPSTLEYSIVDGWTVLSRPVVWSVNSNPNTWSVVFRSSVFSVNRRV